LFSTWPAKVSESPGAIPPEAAGDDANRNAHSLILRLQGFEGPLDLLLDLARAQKVDLANISILALVDQYLAIIEGARRIRLELAADWLVMAAWLAWLKSRLLVPQGVEETEDTELLAGNLAERLLELQAIRRAAQWLNSRPQLGLDIFARGSPEDLTETDRSGLKLDLPGLLRGYISALRRGVSQRRYTPRPMIFWSVQDALKRLGSLMGQVPDWTELSSFLPEEPPAEPLARRAALASTLLAGLEMARGGAIALRQDELFGPIMVKRGEGKPEASVGMPARPEEDSSSH
jgi:segregation and condensation protein A